jgi:ribonuclease P protein component
MKPFGFPRRARLRGRWEFTRAQRAGEKIHVRFFLVFAIASVSQRKLEEKLARKADARAKSGAAFVSSAPVSGNVSNRASSARLGVTVTKKVGNSVVRNRIKRWVREAFRLHASRLPDGIDLVFVAKHNANKTSFAEVSADMLRLVGRSWATIRGRAALGKSDSGGADLREPRHSAGMGSAVSGVLPLERLVDEDS